MVSPIVAWWQSPQWPHSCPLGHCRMVPPTRPSPSPLLSPPFRPRRPHPLLRPGKRLRWSPGGVSWTQTCWKHSAGIGRGMGAGGAAPGASPAHWFSAERTRGYWCRRNGPPHSGESHFWSRHWVQNQSGCSPGDGATHQRWCRKAGTVEEEAWAELCVWSGRTGRRAAWMSPSLPEELRGAAGDSSCEQVMMTALRKMMKMVKGGQWWTMERWRSSLARCSLVFPPRPPPPPPIQALPPAPPPPPLPLFLSGSFQKWSAPRQRHQVSVWVQCHLLVGSWRSRPLTSGLRLLHLHHHHRPVRCRPLRPWRRHLSLSH